MSCLIDGHMPQLLLKGSISSVAMSDFNQHESLINMTGSAFVIYWMVMHKKNYVVRKENVKEIIIVVKLFPNDIEIFFSIKFISSS